jgi:hypothetical protein
VERLQDMDLDDQCDIMNILMSRFPYGSEMSGSGAAQDPLFWVAHGAIERLVQRAIFSGITKDTEFSSTNQHCSGAADDVSRLFLGLIALRVIIS